MVNMAKLSLPAMVIGLDVKEHRLMLGKEYGADAAFNPAADNIDEEIRKMTKGKGCDVYIEASGSPASVKQVCACCATMEDMSRWACLQKK